MTDNNHIGEMLKEAGKAAEERQLQRAEALLAQVLEMSSTNLKALDLMGFIYFFQNRYDDCEQMCRRALEIKPGHAYALAGLGMSLARRGRLEEGILQLEQAMTVQPEWPEPYWDSAVILMEKGEAERAVQVLQKGIACAPKARARFTKLLSKISDKQFSAK